MRWFVHMTIVCVVAFNYVYSMEQSAFVEHDPQLAVLHERLKWLPSDVRKVTRQLDCAFRDCGNFDTLYSYLLMKTSKNSTYRNPNIEYVLHQVGLTNGQDEWDSVTNAIVVRALSYPQIIDLLKYPFRKQEREADMVSYHKLSNSNKRIRTL